MKTRFCGANLLAFIAGLLVTCATSVFSQITVTVLGNKWTVVQYDTGSTTKFYDTGFLNHIGRKDGSFKSGPPQSKNDIYRTGFDFNLHGHNIMNGSTIHKVEHVSTIGGTNYNAKTKSLSSTQDMANPTNLWDAIGNSQTTYFSNIPYGSNQRVDSSAAFRQAVQEAVNGSGRLKLGIMSQSENENNTHTAAEVFLRVTYTPPPGKIVVTNSFGGGKIKVDGDPTVESGRQFTWSAGSQHTLEALDQIWPASSGKSRTFDDRADKGWRKIDASNPNGRTITTSRSFTYTVQAGESATLEAQFKTDITVSGTLTIASGSLYTIEPNTTVSCLSGSKIIVNGALQAIGKQDEPIVFTSPTGESWEGIEFNGDGGTSNGSSLHYCTIRYAKTAIKATNKPNLTVYQSTISNSSFYNGSDNAAMAFYNSSPTISNVTINGQSNSWNGVRFAQGSSGSISNSTIQNCGAGNGIVVQGNSNPTIAFNSIVNNAYHGILLSYNSGGVLQGNFIDRSGTASYSGVYAIGSGAYLEENVIESFENGVLATDGSSLSSSVRGGMGKNVIYGNTYGIKADNQSYLQFGVYYSDNLPASWGWCNKIHGNAIADAVGTRYSTINARGNFWDANPPWKFQIESGSSIDYSCWLFDSGDCYTSSCSGGCPDCPQRIVFDGRRILHEAHRIKGQQALTEQAAGLYLQVIERSRLLNERLEAVVALMHLVGETGIREPFPIVSALAQEASLIGATASFALMQMHASIGEFSQAKRIAEELRSKHPNTDVERRALTFLASLFRFSTTERNTSKQALKALQEQYQSSLDLGLMTAFETTIAQEAFAGVAGETSYQIFLTAYPNPFNPSTTIQFRLTTPGVARVKVYDVLGREVATLVNEHKEAGLHAVQWDAGSLPSGMYFYRLEANGKSYVQKMLLVR